TKAVHVFGRVAWVWDNSHDIVLARMVEAADDLGSISEATLNDWCVWASIGDLSFEFPARDATAVADVLRVPSHARSAIQAHGDVVAGDLVGWSVLDGHDVSGGFLRDELPVGALLDVARGFEQLLTKTLEPDPPSGWWFLGLPDGRQ